jgi:Protein of unknown function (DUF3987)
VSQYFIPVTGKGYSTKIHMPAAGNAEVKSNGASGAHESDERQANVDSRNIPEKSDGSTEQDKVAKENGATHKPHGASADTLLASNDAAWPKMDNAAYHGLVGRVVKAIEPTTESDPNAIMIQFIAFFGNKVGRGAYYLVEDDPHYPIIFSVLSGVSSKGRKGTSAGRVRRISRLVDEQWESDHICSGMSSGEGLIWAVRDAIPDKNDSGVSDKRLMVLENEFSSALTVMHREGNILKDVVRDAWDGRRKLATLTKHSPASATEATISIVGHITDDELRQGLDRVSMANGYANRFLYARVRRARFLPHGGSLDEKTVGGLAADIKSALERAKSTGRVKMNAEAHKHWEVVYQKLSEGQPGLLGAIIARAEPQVLRIALIYALLDAKPDDPKVEIDVVHLRAALAVWEYCEESARQIFGDALGNPVADVILKALKTAGPEGLTRTQIRVLFGRNQSANQIEFGLAMLSEGGKAKRAERKAERPGRPTEIWVEI